MPALVNDKAIRESMVSDYKPDTKMGAGGAEDKEQGEMHRRKQVQVRIDEGNQLKQEKR